MTNLKVLLSYARADGSDASAQLRSELQAAGYDVWRDIEEMRASKDWKDQIRQAIGAVNAVIVLFTPGSVMSTYVLWECDTAQTLGKPIIGLLIQRCAVPADLARFHYHDLSITEKYMRGFDHLIRDLRELEVKNVSQHKPEHATPSSAFFEGATNIQIRDSQVGNGNTQINNPSVKPSNDVRLAQLIQQISALLKTEHQQLRLMLITELQAMSAEQREQIEMIVKHYQQGQISSADMVAFMSDVRTVLTSLQSEANSSNSELRRLADEVEQIFGSQLSQEHKFELTLPILPGIFEYKYSFAGTIDIDIRNLIDRLKQSWDEWKR
jgi:hypothetical protein